MGESIEELRSVVSTVRQGVGSEVPVFAQSLDTVEEVTLRGNSFHLPFC